MKKNVMWVLSFLVLGSLLILTSCGGDDKPDPIAPELSIDIGTFTGDIGSTVTATISGELDGEFVSLTISKFIGVTLDDTYGVGGTLEVTSGLPYSFTYTLGADGILEPIRFNFLVTDANGLTDDVDLIITTNTTNSGLIVSFGWRYSSLLFDGQESIQECEKDNVFTFETDGSMAIDYGALTGEGGGSCDFDNAVDWASWEFNSDESVLFLRRVDVQEDGSTTPKDTLQWTIVEMDQTAFTATEESIFGPLTYVYQSVSKN